MIQPELWMLTPFVLFVSLKIPLINADDKSQRKPSDQNENYIITHYGKEYYTPVTDIESAAQRSQSGYYTAEVIPVDVRTGEELKPVKNLFVPMHTGYSIGVTDDVDPPPAPPPTYLSSSSPKKAGGKFAATTSRGAADLGPDGEFFAREDNNAIKSKIPKKFFKSKYATVSKKSGGNVVPNYSGETTNIGIGSSSSSSSSSSSVDPATTVVVLGEDATNQQQKNHQKRNAFHNPDEEFLRMFYDNFKTLMQQHYLGYY